MARANFVKKAQKSIPGTDIKKGDSYYWWKFRFGGKHVSKTPPRRSQLTQSAFYGGIYDLEDEVIAKASADDSLSSTRDEVVSALEDVRDQCQDSLDNMPESLQQAPTGELLQERIDAMESAISEFEDLELEEPTEDDLELPEQNEGETDDDYAKRTEEARAEAVTEYWQGKLDEFTGISIDTP